LAAIVALGAAVRFWLLQRPIAALDGRALPDDAYLAMQIARSIGNGDGPRFVDHLTNGFQPLFVWLSALGFAGSDPGPLATPDELDAKIKFALAIATAFDVGSLWLIARAVRCGSGSAAAGLFAGLLWALHPTVLRVSVNGLETSLAIFALLAVWNVVLSRRLAESSPRRWFGIGIAVGVAAMARVDLLVLGLFFGFESLRAARSVEPRPWMVRNLALAAGTALGYAPWVVYSWIYTSAILPASGRAVRWISLTHADHATDAAFYLGMLGDGALALDSNLPILGKLALVVAGVALFRRGRPGWLALPGVFGLSLFLAYTLYVFAPWFFPRYLAPLNVFAIASVSAALGWAVERSGRHRSWSGAVAVAAIVLLCVAQPRFGKLMFAPPDDQIGYRNLGLWARSALRPGTTVGATQSGALAYYANGYRTLNLDGVVNADAYDAMSRGRALDYMREQEVDYVVAWRRNYLYLKRNAAGFRETDLPVVGYIDGFRSWGIQWQLFRLHYPSGRTPPPLARN
jgi:hypothetical protein